MDTIVSFYKFNPISDCKAFRNTLKQQCTRQGLKGTILVAPEGINGTVAGSAAGIAHFSEWIRSQSGFEDLPFKHSFYDGISYRRLLIKIKKEIITMRRQVDPRKKTGAYLAPQEFKKWQDEGKPMVVLDTRNDYEVAMGTFEQAINPNIKTFSEFPKWIDENLQDKKDMPVVTFCTGGVRCEKATAYMLDKGFREVYQLDGGILRYFEETQTQANDDNHWRGECVVFDKRKAVNKELKASEQPICFVCLQQLTDNNHRGEEMPAGKLCRSCAVSMQRHQSRRLERGFLRNQENLEKRRAFLAKQRETYRQATAVGEGSPSSGDA